MIGYNQKPSLILKEAAGYNNSERFNRSLRRLTGMSTAQCRNAKQINFKDSANLKK
ncbi:MAG: hypothetical protein KH230_18055 [Enterocloster asparagiformis]|nr:hypothetical protein [Enterocloster asparagiformis]